MIIIMNTNDEATRARGRELRGRAQGARTDELGTALAAVDPALRDWADEFIFGSVWDREGLEFDDRLLVAIVALAAREQHTQLRNYLHGALQDGVDARRIHEALLMLVVYIGFPAGIAALAAFKDVLATHERRVAKESGR